MANAVSSTVQTDANSLMAVITRAASDQTVDVVKLEKLMEMYERITAGRAKAEFDAALAEMQPNLPTVAKNGSIKVPNRDPTAYALLEDIQQAIAPILAKYGFAVSFRTSSDAKVKVTAILSHKAGHREETSLELSHDSSGSKNGVQAIGSSIKYGMRYTLCALLNIATEGADDDGETAIGTITQDQADQICSIINTNGFSIDDFLKWAHVDAVSNIRCGNFQKVMTALDAKVKAKAKK